MYDIYIERATDVSLGSTRDVDDGHRSSLMPTEKFIDFLSFLFRVRRVARSSSPPVRVCRICLFTLESNCS